LRPVLEGPRGDMWKQLGCAKQEIDPCVDFLAAWFVWAIQDAAGRAGHTHSGSDSNHFYRQIATEIDAACSAGRLDCLGVRSTLAPPFRLHYIADALAVAPKMMTLLLSFGASEIGTRFSTGTAEQRALFARLTRTPELTVVSPIVRIRGWIAAPHDAPSITVVDEDGAIAGQVESMPAPDVEAAYRAREFAAYRFTIAPECPKSTCRAVIASTAGTYEVPLQNFAEGVAGDAAIALAIEQVDLDDPPDLARIKVRRAQVQEIARQIARAYAAAATPLFVAGCAGLLLALLTLGQNPALLIGFGLSALAAVAARIALLSYLDVTAIPSQSTLYLSPASPFVLIVITIGVWLGVRSAWFLILAKREH
jgi:hypothetical protein